MMCACINGHTEVVEILLKYPQSPVVYTGSDDKSYNVLDEAISRSRE